MTLPAVHPFASKRRRPDAVRGVSRCRRKADTHPGLRGITCINLIFLATIGSGCEPPSAAPGGVIAVIGHTGLGPGEFAYPRAIAAAPDGSVFVVDKAGRVQRFSADGTFEWAWRMPEVHNGKPVGLTVHPDGRLFIADTHYHRVLITDRDGTLLDTFGREGFGDGEFQLPTDVAIDAEGFIYVGEYDSNDRITKWSPDLRFIRAFGDEPIPLEGGERLARPAGLAIDAEQTLWVADACNHRLVRFSLDGDVLAVIGSFGDAPGKLRYPYDIEVTPEDTLLVCEYGGNRLQWFAKDGRSLRIRGRAGRAPGEFFAPWGATCGSNGQVYVVDSQNNRVQILTP